jgi:phosphate transport system substrate-binding protein
MKNISRKGEKKMINFRKFRLFVILVLISFLLGGGSILATETIVVIKGSTTILPIAQSCAEVFMEENQEISISVQGGGSGVGIASLIDKTCNIATASRPIKEKERATAQEKGVNPVETVVARDAIALVVHPSNILTGLTLADIKAIYTGKVSNWSEVGGADQEIIVVSRDSASGTFETFNELALEGEKVRADALLQASNAAVVTTVANTPGAIGYVGLGYVSKEVKALSVNEVMPSKETVNAGNYPLARSLFMYTDGKPEGAVKKFVDFVLSAEGQKLVEENGYISL